MSDVRSQLNSVKEMCQNLIEDQPFKQFLSLVLLVGNYLNAVSILISNFSLVALIAKIHFIFLLNIVLRVLYTIIVNL